MVFLHFSSGEKITVFMELTVWSTGGQWSDADERYIHKALKNSSPYDVQVKFDMTEDGSRYDYSCHLC